MGKKVRDCVKLEKKNLKKQQKKEQQTTKKSQTICLNMIVKNEAHIIEELLETIAKYIDYYVISDTGSTDGTQKKIKDYFDEIGIPGEIHQNTWVCPHPEIDYFDFGKNRSMALDLCAGKGDYI